MLVRMAEAIGRLVLAGRELTRLAGFTSRVYELMVVLKDLHKGRYTRTMVTTGNGRETTDEGTPFDIHVFVMEQIDLSYIIVSVSIFM